MSEDQQTYQRGISAAITGLIAQIILTVIMALLGLYAQSSAMHAATLHLLGGVAVWIILAVLFYQQKQERIEALEAEQLAETDAATAAIFNEAGDQLHFARKRLANLIKWWLNIVSLALATYLIAIGVYYIASSQSTLEMLMNFSMYADEELIHVGLAPTANTAVIAVITLGIAFISFLISRYLAGMTRVRAWEPLRGGAGYVMGSGFLALLILIAAILRYFGVGFPAFAAIDILIPAFMILIGFEIVLGFIFGLYRPRKPGEAPRPAFESRILGWLTRPESIGKIIGETINYQFGFEISASWFYRLLSKAIVPLFTVGAIILLALSSLVVVGPHENAVITTFGNYERVVESGLRFKYPWPVSRAEKYNVYDIHELDIASSETDNWQPGTAILWTNEHAGEEQFFLTAEPVSRSDTGQSSDAIAAGLIGGRITVQYRISDLEKYIKAADNPKELFRRRAESLVSQFFATHEVDHLLSTARLEAGKQLTAELQAQTADLGINVLQAAVTALHPPQKEEVALKFLEQIDAELEKQAKLTEANKDAVTTLTKVAGSRDQAIKIDEAIIHSQQLQSQLEQLRRSDNYDAAKAQTLADAIAKQDTEIEKLMDAAGGEAISEIYKARSDRWSFALSERARSMRTRSEYLIYLQAPEYFRSRKYLAVLGEGMEDRRKIVTTVPNADEAIIRLDLKDQAATLGAFEND